MPIHKSQHAGNFTTIPNEIFKNQLSIEAVGLLCYLLSLPPKWVIYKTTLHEFYNIGRKKIDRVFKELQNSGYILSVKTYNNGKIEHEHIVYDIPFNGEKPLNFKNQPHPQNVRVGNGCVSNFENLPQPPFVQVEKEPLVKKHYNNKYNKKEKEYIYAKEIKKKLTKDNDVSLNAFNSFFNPSVAAPLKKNPFPKNDNDFKNWFYNELGLSKQQANVYWNKYSAYSDNGNYYTNWKSQIKYFISKDTKEGKLKTEPKFTIK